MIESWNDSDEQMTSAVLRCLTQSNHERRMCLCCIWNKEAVNAQSFDSKGPAMSELRGWVMSCEIVISM